jgi:hypothetical protein
MNTDTKDKMIQTERLVKKVSQLAQDLNGNLENRYFEKASDVLLEIEKTLNAIKWYNKGENK